MRFRPAILLLLASCGSNNGVPARWESRAPVPNARTEVSVAADDSLIYLIGGYGRGEGRRPSAPRAMLAYYPASDRWTALGEIPEGLNHSSLAAVGSFYIVGGFRESSGSATGAVPIYDPVQRTWSDGAPMPTPRGPSRSPYWTAGSTRSAATRPKEWISWPTITVSPLGTARSAPTRSTIPSGTPGRGWSRC